MELTLRPADSRSNSAKTPGTLECGEALNAEGYVVVPEGGHLVVKFQTTPARFLWSCRRMTAHGLRQYRCHRSKSGEVRRQS